MIQVQRQIEHYGRTCHRQVNGDGTILLACTYHGLAADIYDDDDDLCSYQLMMVFISHRDSKHELMLLLRHRS